MTQEYKTDTETTQSIAEHISNLKFIRVMRYADVKVELNRISLKVGKQPILIIDVYRQGKKRQFKVGLCTDREGSKSTIQYISCVNSLTELDILLRFRYEKKRDRLAVLTDKSVKRLMRPSEVWNIATDARRQYDNWLVKPVITTQRNNKIIEEYLKLLKTGKGRSEAIKLLSTRSWKIDKNSMPQYLSPITIENILKKKKVTCRQFIKHTMIKRDEQIATDYMKLIKAGNSDTKAIEMLIERTAKVDESGFAKYLRPVTIRGIIRRGL